MCRKHRLTADVLVFRLLLSFCPFMWDFLTSSAPNQGLIPFESKVDSCRENPHCSRFLFRAHASLFQNFGDVHFCFLPPSRGSWQWLSNWDPLSFLVYKHPSVSLLFSFFNIFASPCLYGGSSHQNRLQHKGISNEDLAAAAALEQTGLELSMDSKHFYFFLPLQGFLCSLFFNLIYLTMISPPTTLPSYSLSTLYVLFLSLSHTLYVPCLSVSHTHTQTHTTHTIMNFKTNKK